MEMNLTDFMKMKQIKEHRKLNEDEVKKIMKQILLGVDYLHSRGFIHRDLKPENFVINPDTLETKMIDFGTVKDIGKHDPPYSTYVSTRWYRSPECVLRSPSYGTASDMFAVGCIMAELYNGKPLFPGTSELDQLEVIFVKLGTPSQT